ncbi:hypothetical protein BDQ17DRAFT_1320885 [Cyathus striatus]|nr:hypothetical protein BDQ17DRAFT_1320885 [Cyathus striatus]
MYHWPRPSYFGNSFDYPELPEKCNIENVAGLDRSQPSTAQSQRVNPSQKFYKAPAIRARENLCSKRTKENNAEMVGVNRLPMIPENEAIDTGISKFHRRPHVSKPPVVNKRNTLKKDATNPETKKLQSRLQNIQEQRATCSTHAKSKKPKNLQINLNEKVLAAMDKLELKYESVPLNRLVKEIKKS